MARPLALFCDSLCIVFCMCETVFNARFLAFNKDSQTPSAPEKEGGDM